MRVAAFLLQGQFVGVVGKVGSGKSSLLNALLAEMEREGGQIRVGGLEEGFAYASQEPWVQQASLRDNVLFGRQHRPETYSAVLEGCALTEDLKVRGSILGKEDVWNQVRRVNI